MGCFFLYFIIDWSFFTLSNDCGGCHWDQGQLYSIQSLFPVLRPFLDNVVAKIYRDFPKDSKKYEACKSSQSARPSPASPALSSSSSQPQRHFIFLMKLIHGPLLNKDLKVRKTNLGIQRPENHTSDIKDSHPKTEIWKDLRYKDIAPKDAVP